MKYDYRYYNLRLYEIYSITEEQSGTVNCPGPHRGGTVPHSRTRTETHVAWVIGKKKDVKRKIQHLIDHDDLGGNCATR